MLTRRTFQAGLIAAPALASLHARAESAADLDLAIIGAGAAGLFAAHRAREKGLKAKVFEARNRIGGRLYTDSSLGDAFEAGAFYIHFAERNPWRGVAEKAGFELVDDNTLNGGFNVFRNGQPIPQEERGRRRGAFGRLSAIVEDAAPGADFSFAEAAQKFAPDLFEAAQSMTLLSLGEDPERVSMRDYQMLDSGDDLVLPGGYGTLAIHHAAGLDIALATPVTEIDSSGAAIRLVTPSGEVRARAVIITVPIGVLQAEGIRFTSALPVETQHAIHGLGMGALSKVALKFEGNRFGQGPWTQFFDQGTPSGKGPPDDLVNFEFWPFGRNLVIAMFGGDFARGLAAAGEQAAVSAILDRLVRILGEDARKAFRGGRLAGWSADPFARGGYSIAKPGQVAARKALEAPVQARIWFAGEANAGAASMTAGGAALAGSRAVDEAAAMLSRKTGN